MRPVDKAQPITTAGVQGYSVVMQSTSPFPDANGHPRKEHDWLVTVPRSDGSLVYFVFVAPQSEFRALPSKLSKHVEEFTVYALIEDHQIAGLV